MNPNQNENVEKTAKTEDAATPRAGKRLRPLPPEYVAMNIVSCASSSNARVK